MNVDPKLLRSGPNESGIDPVKSLTDRLRRDRYIRVALGFLERCGDAHMKDLTHESGDDQRMSVIEGKQVVNFGSANFLGFDFDPRLQDAVIRTVREKGVHQYCSRSFYSSDWYDQAERGLAEWLDVEDTLIFPCVTKLHAGVIPALAGGGRAGRGPLLAQQHLERVEDRVGQRRGGARVRRPAAQIAGEAVPRQGAGGCVVLVDGVYSMTGEIPPLAQLFDIATRHNAILYVDDAHGTGVVGPRGQGAAAAEGLRLRDLLYVGSLSKGFSSLGGFITCSPALKLILKMKADSYIFSGPIPASYLAATCRVLDIIRTMEFDQRLTTLHQRIDQLTHGLRRMNLVVRGGVAPIVSVAVGDIERTLAAGRRLFEMGYYVQSVTYPAVPINGGLLRIQVNASHSPAAINGLIDAIGQVLAVGGFVRAVA